MNIRIRACLTAAAVFLLAATAQAETAPGDEVLLQRGAVTVTAADVEQYLRERVPPEALAGFLRKANSLRDVAENLYVIRTLAAEAEGIEELDHEQIAWQVETQRQRLLMNAVLAHVVDLRLADQDWDAAAREVYVAEPERFRVEEQVRVSHILVKTEGRGEEEALALVQSLRERALQGEDFAALARDHSEDPSAKKNAGDLGFFRRGQMVAPFEEVAFAMQEPGTLSEPVQTRFGYHLIRYQERREPEQRSFEEVKDQIIQELQQKIANHARQTEVARVRSLPDIQWHTDRLEQLQERLLETLE